MTIDGKDVQKDPEEAKRAIGYLPELPPLYVDMTVRDYLDFVAELKKVPKKERKQQIDEVMDCLLYTSYGKGDGYRRCDIGFQWKHNL